MSGEPLPLHRKLLTDHPQEEEGDNGDNKGDNSGDNCDNKGNIG